MVRFIWWMAAIAGGIIGTFYIVTGNIENAIPYLGCCYGAWANVRLEAMEKQ
jgi:hypothetical protein